MGLMLSIFVAAIGVVELLAFYDRVLDNVRLANNQPEHDLSKIRSYYIKTLQSEDARRSTSPSLLEEVIPRRRSLSPYPSLDLSAPRNSICRELLNPSINVSEVDEEVYSDASSSSKDSSPEPETRKFRDKQSPVHLSPIRKAKSRSKSRSPNLNGNSSGSTSRSVSPLPFREPSELVEIPLTRKRATSENLSNRFDVKVEVIKKSPSSTEIVEENYWKRSPSPFGKLLKEEYEHETTSHKSEFTYVKFESRNSDIPSVKVSDCKEVEEEQQASSSFCGDTNKTLAQVANTLSEQKAKMEKKPEPFWVK